MIKSTYTVEDDLFIRKDTQDVSRILTANANDRNSGENDASGKNMRKIASIPLTVVESLRTRSWKDGGPIDINLIGENHEHAARFTLWLNDRDYRGFRTSNARV